MVKLYNPEPNFSEVTLQDLIDRGLMDGDLTSAAKKAVESFDRITKKRNGNSKGF